MSEVFKVGKLGIGFCLSIKPLSSVNKCYVLKKFSFVMASS